MRRLAAIAVCLLSCTAAAPQAVTPAAAPDAAPATAAATPGTRLLGVLHRLGRRSCPDGRYQHKFVDERWAVGLVPLEVPPALEPTLAAARGRPVLVWGAPFEAAPAPVADGDSADGCPEMQMRGDWIDSPDGILIRRSDPPLGGLRVTGARAWGGLTAALAGDGVALRVTHDLGDAPLQGAALVGHYEGCRGKPGTAADIRPLGAVAPGATVGASLPAIFLRPRRQAGAAEPHALHSVELRATGSDDLFVALDVPLAALGVAPIDCPG